jgi:hypothetical protein
MHPQDEERTACPGLLTHKAGMHAGICATRRPWPCPARRHYLRQRDVTAVLYLNSSFTGGDLLVRSGSQCPGLSHSRSCSSAQGSAAMGGSTGDRRSSKLGQHVQEGFALASSKRRQLESGGAAESGLQRAMDEEDGKGAGRGQPPPLPALMLPPPEAAVLALRSLQSLPQPNTTGYKVRNASTSDNAVENLTSTGLQPAQATSSEKRKHGAKEVYRVKPVPGRLVCFWATQASI